MRARRRTPALLSPGRWLVLAVLTLLLIAALLLIYYSYIQSDRWEERDKYQALAKREAGLVKIEAASKFIWDDTYWVVRGQDGEGRSQYVWLADGKRPVVIGADEAASRSDVAERLRADKPDAAIERIQPGMLQDRPVWEVLYTRKKSPRHFFYDFYDFRDGTKLGTYTLPSKLSEKR